MRRLIIVAGLSIMLATMARAAVAAPTPPVIDWKQLEDWINDGNEDNEVGEMLCDTGLNSKSQSAAA